MKNKSIVVKLSRFLTVILVFTLFLFSFISIAAASSIDELNALIAEAETLKAGNKEFPLQISYTDDGSDVNQAFPWVFDEELEDLDAALEFARNASPSEIDDAINRLRDEIEKFKGKIKADGSDPYFRLDPGPGLQQIVISTPTNEWRTRTPLDSRVPRDFDGSTFEVIPYPFADSDGKSDVLKINYVYKGQSTFGGISLEAPLSPVVNIPSGATIEFDVYYPRSAQGKFMRWRLGTNLDTYMREYEYNNLNPDWVGSYQGETWYKAHHSVTAPTGTMSTFTLELHGETSRPAETGTLIVADIKIMAPDPDGIPLPPVVNNNRYNEVAPLKSVYNNEYGLFMVGTLGSSSISGLRAYHYEIFVDGNNLKAEPTHPRGPNWLRSVDGQPLIGVTTTHGLNEYSFPTNNNLGIRNSCAPGEYKCHGHVLALYNQAPAWMRQIVPATLPHGYIGTTEFF